LEKPVFLNGNWIFFFKFILICGFFSVLPKLKIRVSLYEQTSLYVMRACACACVCAYWFFFIFHPALFPLCEGGTLTVASSYLCESCIYLMNFVKFILDSLRSLCVSLGHLKFIYFCFNPLQMLIRKKR
jgi:hypothetical protein